MIHAKHLVVYWYSEGHTSEAINAKLKDYFGAILPPYSTVTCWCWKLKFKCDIRVVRSGPVRRPEVDLDNAILDALNEIPFHDLGSLPRVLNRPLSTIRDHLITGLINKYANLYERIHFSTDAASPILARFVQSREGWESESFKTLGNFWKRSVKWPSRFGPLNWTPYFATGKTDFEDALNWTEDMWTETMLKW
jgi:hypothetical protein